MPREPIDKLISLHFKHERKAYKLDMLEQDVLQRVHTRQASSGFSWRELSVASIALALVVGLGAGNVLQQGQSLSREMGLHIFSAQVGYLPSTLLEGTK